MVFPWFHQVLPASCRMSEAFCSARIPGDTAPLSTPHLSDLCPADSPAHESLHSPPTFKKTQSPASKRGTLPKEESNLGRVRLPGTRINRKTKNKNFPQGTYLHVEEVFFKENFFQYLPHVGLTSSYRLHARGLTHAKKIDPARKNYKHAKPGNCPAAFIASNSGRLMVPQSESKRLPVAFVAGEANKNQSKRDQSKLWGDCINILTKVSEKMSYPTHRLHTQPL